jgi:hypothetical protein
MTHSSHKYLAARTPIGHAIWSAPRPNFWPAFLAMGAAICDTSFRSAEAENEGRRINERTKAALQAAKARGVKLGSPIAVETMVAARPARSRYSANANATTRAVIADIQRSGVTTYRGIAKALQARGSDARRPGRLAAYASVEAAGRLNECNSTARLTFTWGSGLWTGRGEQT